jgi:hypothetical protein
MEITKKTLRRYIQRSNHDKGLRKLMNDKLKLEKFEKIITLLLDVLVVVLVILTLVGAGVIPVSIAFSLCVAISLVGILIIYKDKDGI